MVYGWLLAAVHLCGYSRAIPLILLPPELS